ncbi:MAG: bifunctional phosphoribosylaminoimidazolecarboxamide formyltransferase/IMP cyclohydrolase [Acidobacteria bacterium RIFCSPLOWO2_02_FULL_64_15]|nr:MAG: bifunctional phosphoribosylaminoimidazolecarboxamide formyltransferase/IMP cyclohydrolase [Acidobacteria bacterium RIFCSPLOWO2_02_FULL_64_15]
MPRALLSVSDKTGIVDVGRGLAARGFELVSTGGTARALADAGLAVTSVSEVTGFPEMMDGRVKTLHPALFAGILARRDRPDDLAALARHDLALVDVVVVNLYPFVKAAANPSTPFDALVEEIDIGGPSLVRAAAKNFRGVLVVVDPVDYPRLLASLDGTPSLGLRFGLACKAIAHTAAYDTAITETLATVRLDGDRFERRPPAAGELPDRVGLSLEKIRDLRYGENPHQRAAWYRPSGSDVVSGFSRTVAASGLGAATILQGKELSYTNLLDLDAAARIVLEFAEPAAAVIKHTNPCGAATGDSPADAYVRARDADSLAAFGGIVALNRPVDVRAAEAIVSTFIEAVIAPAVDEAARPVLARKTNMRVVTADFSSLGLSRVEQRSILGAALIQERDQVVEAARAWAPGALPEGLRVVTKRQPTVEEWEALRFAWRLCAHVKSNTVIFTDARRTLAIGAGQMSRVDAVGVAVMKAQGAARSLAGSVAASDAFFPFRDGLDAVAKAGATAVVQPGGSVRDAEVIAAADEQGLAMVFTGRRHFRH